jgi:hypothetical protein
LHSYYFQPLPELKLKLAKGKVAITGRAATTDIPFELRGKQCISKRERKKGSCLQSCGEAMNELD